MSRRCIDGVLLLDKPSGITSNAALQRAKRALNAQKAGHTGTLDPLASGLLPLCFGEATKFAQTLLDARKRYTATVRFGATTATGDAEGPVTASFPVAFTEDALRATLAAMEGPQLQIPPTYSALKFEGRPHYEYARAGVEVPRLPRPITLHALHLVSWQPPDAVVDIECSKGTYIRVLAEDLGRILGGGAHLAALRRTGTGVFALADAIALADFEALERSVQDGRLLPVDAPLADVALLVLNAPMAAALTMGQQLGTDAAAGRYRAYGPGDTFLGLADVAAGRLSAVRLVKGRDLADASVIDLRRA
ncbi:MAG: tRNA pseudouridine(55) synthase TruB [Casimicrobiaceae bacterium]